MEENKNQSPNRGNHRHKPYRNHHNRQGGERQEEGGQRISVRPGNFTPPPRKENAAPAAPVTEQKRPTPEREGNGESRAQQGNRNHHGHHGHNRNRNRRPQNAQNAQNAQREAVQEKPQNREDGQRNNARQDDKRGRSNNHADRNDRRQKQQAVDNTPKAPLIGAELQTALDEEFGTPRLSERFSLFSAPQKQAADNADSEEFAVDIATADYLLDDVPCGFPIPDGKSVEVVGVRFRHAGKMYFFAPGDLNLPIGAEVLVDTARGAELGEIVMLKRRIAEKDVIQPLRQVLRLATKEDKEREQENRRKEKEALKLCAEKIAHHKLEMRLVDAQYAFDNSKLLFYFTSEGRVDFRELVRDLASVFHTRIELRQIGIRDESRLIGGLGMCGRPFCCSTHLSDFGQVSIKMAKEQGLSINTSKISGCCGRLMCCLRYEHETYAEETRLTPKKDTPVLTPDGEGVVVEAIPLAGTVKVKLNAAPEEPAKPYHRDSVTVLRRGKPCEECKKAENGTEKAEKKSAATATETPAETTDQAPEQE